MELAVTAVALAAGALLAGWWAVRLRRDLERREGRSGRSPEWDGAPDDGGLWTSGARCPECRERGALLARQDGQLWHTCMACGHRHARENRG